MKIGVSAVVFGSKPFEETLDYLVELGVQAVEIGTGAYPGDAHCKPAALLASEKKLKAFRPRELERWLVVVQETDVALKSSRRSADAILEEMFTRLCRRAS